MSFDWKKSLLQERLQKRMSYSILLLFSLVICSSSAYQWEPFTSSFSANAFGVKRGGINHYYCQVKQGQDVFTGTVSDKERRCVVAKVREQKIERFDDFQVFALSSGEKANFFYYTKNSDTSSAVPCTDSHLTNCFLGHSVYGDGICWEMIGKADPIDKRKVFYETPADDGKFEGCPFVMLLKVVQGE